jgi:hypothetical protein
MLAIIIGLAAVGVGGCAASHASSGSAGSGAGGWVASRETVLLEPGLNAGGVGWCMTPVGSSESGCGASAGRPPIIEESWSAEVSPGKQTSGYALVPSSVAAVNVNGSGSYATRDEVGLPAGLRVVSVELPGEAVTPFPRFGALGSAGDVVTGNTSGQVSGFGPLFAEIETTQLADAAHPTVGPCRISERRSGAARVEGGSVVTHLRPFGGLIGQGFEVCASTSYNLRGWPLLAGVLLSASHPRMRAPAPPLTRPASGHPGVYEALGGAEREPILLERVGPAWLFVARAERTERLTLLRELTVTLSL